jgi:hypothetical protein
MKRLVLTLVRQWQCPPKKVLLPMSHPQRKTS